MTTVLELDAHEELFETPRQVPQQQVELRIRPNRVLKTLLCIVALLIITGSTASVITHKILPSPDHKLAKLMNRFDINFEPSIPAWYSACALLTSGGLLTLTGLARMQSKDRFFKHWLVLGLLFVGLSMDESARFHEMIHTVIISRIEVHGIFYLPWVVPALIFVAAVGVSYIPFLRHIDRRTAKLFLVAGSVYVMGAVGMEMVAGPIIEKHGIFSSPHIVCEVIEETLEMLGIVIFIYALLDHLARCVGPIRLQVVSPAQR